MSWDVYKYRRKMTSPQERQYIWAIYVHVHEYSTCTHYLISWWAYIVHVYYFSAQFYEAIKVLVWGYRCTYFCRELQYAVDENYSRVVRAYGCQCESRYTVLGSMISASSDTVESEGRQMEQSWMTYTKKEKCVAVLLPLKIKVRLLFGRLNYHDYYNMVAKQT